MLIYYHNKLILSRHAAQSFFIIVRQLKLFVFMNLVVKAFCLFFFCLFFCFFFIRIIVVGAEMHELFELFLLLLLLFRSYTLLLLGYFGVIEHMEIQSLLSYFALVVDFIARLFGKKRINYREDRCSQDKSDNSEQRASDDNAEQYPKA